MLAQIGEGLLGLLFPNLCEVCRTPLVKGERCICLSCLYKMPRTRFWKEKDNEIERLFWGKTRIEHACALFFFRKGSLYRPLIHKLKYSGNRRIGVRLGEELGICLNDVDTFSDVDLLTPVPLHPQKERARGYNQSELIARGISNIMNVPVDTGNLIRAHYTETQTRKNRMERIANVEKVFDVIDCSRFENKHVMLIDDVITTGSTIEACASVLSDKCNCRLSIASLGYASG